MRIDCADDPIAFLDIGIAAAPPLLALLPSWATSVSEAAQRCAGLRSFTMSARSALVLEGPSPTFSARLPTQKTNLKLQSNARALRAFPTHFGRSFRKSALIPS